MFDDIFKDIFKDPKTRVSTSKDEWNTGKKEDIWRSTDPDLIWINEEVWSN
jgi:hypothetical protein